jgi:small conductance mechanosensitive channel
VIDAAQRTGVDKYVHDHADALVTAPLRILIVIVVALVARALAHRSIDRLTRATSEGTVPRILSPLKERASAAASRLESAPLSERRQQRADTIGSVLKSAVSVAVFVLALLVILRELGIDVTALVAGTSILGVGIAFGAQNVIKDFLSGMFMILEDQYGVGDVIDVGPAIGTVEAVGLRTTRLRDETGTVWYVRNGEIARVGNQSQGFAQVVLDVPIDAAADLAGASAAIATTAAHMHADPYWSASFLGAPELSGVQELTREQTVIRLVAQVRPLQQWRVAAELRGRIRLALDRLAVERLAGEPGPADAKSSPARPTADAAASPSASPSRAPAPSSAHGAS